MRSALTWLLDLDALLDDWAIEDVRPVKPPVLPQPVDGFVCPTWNAVIYPPTRAAQDQTCGCRA